MGWGEPPNGAAGGPPELMAIGGNVVVNVWEFGWKEENIGFWLYPREGDAFCGGPILKFWENCDGWVKCGEFIYGAGELGLEFFDESLELSSWSSTCMDIIKFIKLKTRFIDRLFDNELYLTIDISKQVFVLKILYFCYVINSHLIKKLICILNHDK